jgi:mycofactocin precursor
MRHEPPLLEPEPVLPTAATQLAPPPPPAEPDDLILDELLVEDVSIDGMCGVY